MKFTTSEDVFKWMDQTCSQGIQPGLERIKWLLKHLNHPQKKRKFIHIAGTNGKGSTAAMIASVLQEAGYSTGLFISPHIVQWNERIQVDGKYISELSFVFWANYLRPLIDKMIQMGLRTPSVFEFWTVLAICYFAYEGFPHFIVWETGLGGEFDATNIVYPLVSVITHIGLDHQEWLGDTHKQIAQAKSGIIKDGIPVVCGTDQEEVYQVIKQKAKKMNSPFYVQEKDFCVRLLNKKRGSQTFSFTNIYRTIKSLTIQMMGKHQLMNVGTALMTLDILRQYYAISIENEQIIKGLKKVEWPGRLEQISEHPYLIIDGAHNADGVRSLADTIQDMYTYRRFILMIALMKDKDPYLLSPLLSLADKVITTSLTDQKRCLPAEELASHVKKAFPHLSVLSAKSTDQGLAWMKDQATPDDFLLITGSLYLVSEVRLLLVKAI